MDRFETRSAYLQQNEPVNPFAASLEYGFTMAVAVFLIWWVISTLTKKLENIEGLLNKQIQATKDVHNTVDNLKKDFDLATITANRFSEKIAERLKRRWL